MNMNNSAQIWAAFAASWPAVTTCRIGPFIYRDDSGAGSRVSAATLTGAFDADAFDDTEARFAQDKRPALFQIRDGQKDFDRQLAERGYEPFDLTDCLAAPLSQFTAPDPTRGYVCWPPLAIQREIWTAGGTGPARQAVMMRAPAPKTSVLGRLGDQPAGTAFAVAMGGVVVLHALEILPEARRQGLARDLLAIVADWGRAQGAEHFALQVTRANDAAQALYRGLGLQHVGGYHYRRRPLSMVRV